MEKVQDLAKMIDHSILHPTFTDNDLKEGCAIAKKYDVASVCVKPYMVKDAVELLKGSDVKIGCVIGFPHGNSTTKVKVFETIEACKDGAEEIDMVINIGKALQGDLDYVEKEVKVIADACHENGAILKVIIETDFVTGDDMKIALCKVCSQAGADYVKTSSGYGFVKQPNGDYNYVGATIHDLKLMRESVSEGVKIKAAGGVRNLHQLLEVKAAGATRCGATATKSILEDAKRILMILLIATVSLMFPRNAYMQTKAKYLLPDETEYASWEVPVSYSKTYYVDNVNPNASDNNEGTQERPFLTIGKAAETLQPGERVVIHSGIYREQVRPRQGGSGADKLISYEAAPGAKVIVKGSVAASKDNWQKSTGYRLRTRSTENPSAVFQYDMENIDFKGYNPFGMCNVLHNKEYLPWDGGRPLLTPLLLRRGMIFVDGRRMKQVEAYTELASNDDAFWVEHDGLTVHLRLSGDANPAGHDVEFVVREQVFAPKERYLGFIRIKGITFEHGANGFPVPQRGIVSTNRGNHWIIEDCIIRHANAVGLDIGGECWTSDSPLIPVGTHIVRRTQIADAGICGIAGYNAVQTLIESCLIENIGWQKSEQSWESGGIKLHGAQNNVIANCVIRDLIYAPGIWLDYGCNNSRLTNNLIMNVQLTIRGGIYLEASPKSGNLFDHNIIWNVTNMTPGERQEDGEGDGGSGIVVHGSDEGIYAHNLIGLCENGGIKTQNHEWRIVAGGGGISRWNNVENNLFYRCTRAIDFSHKDNFAEGNLYGRSGGVRNRILIPENIQPDLVAWQRYFGFDKNGSYANVNIQINTDDMTMTWSLEGDVPNVVTGAHYRVDFLNHTAGKNRKAGPFATFPENKKIINIDPRIK